MKLVIEQNTKQLVVHMHKQPVYFHSMYTVVSLEDHHQHQFDLMDLMLMPIDRHHHSYSVHLMVEVLEIQHFVHHYKPFVDLMIVVAVVVDEEVNESIANWDLHHLD
jgi:hypothetical protein